jgi:hypothetical protein
MKTISADLTVRTRPQLVLTYYGRTHNTAFEIDGEEVEEIPGTFGFLDLGSVQSSAVSTHGPQLQSPNGFGIQKRSRFPFFSTQSGSQDSDEASREARPRRKSVVVPHHTRLA